MKQIKTVPNQIRFWIKFYMEDNGLDINDYMAWRPGMRKVVKQVYELSPVVYNPDAIAQITGRAKKTIWDAINSQSA